MSHAIITNVAVRGSWAKAESTADGAPQLEHGPVVVNPSIYVKTERIQPHSAVAAAVLSDKPSYIRTESTPEVPQQ